MSRNIEKQEAEQREEADRQSHPHAHHAHLRHSPATILLWTACVVLILLGIFGGIGAASSPDDSTSGIVVGVIILIGAGLICGLLAWHRPLAEASRTSRLASQPFTAAGTVSPRSYSGRHHFKDPRKQAAIFGILFIVSVVAVPFAIGDAQRSTETQNHGVSVNAEISNVNNDTSCHHGSCSTTFSATATLNPPVDGHTMTTVHGQGYFPGDDGESDQILVDPHDAGYAELPGDKLNNSGSWLLFVGLAIVLGFITGQAVLRTLRLYPGLLPSRHVSSTHGVKLV